MQRPESLFRNCSISSTSRDIYPLQLPDSPFTTFRVAFKATTGIMPSFDVIKRNWSRSRLLRNSDYLQKNNNKKKNCSESLNLPFSRDRNSSSPHLESSQTCDVCRHYARRFHDTGRWTESDDSSPELDNGGKNPEKIGNDWRSPFMADLIYPELVAFFVPVPNRHPFATLIGPSTPSVPNPSHHVIHIILTLSYQSA